MIKHSDNKLVTIMEGGMANKFGCIFYAHYLAKKTNKKFVVNSVRNLYGDVGFYHLFSKDNNIEEYENTMTELDNIIPTDIPFILHKNHFVKSGAVSSDREVIFHKGKSHDELMNLINSYGSICFLTDGQNAMANKDETINAVREIKIKKSILKEVNDFCEKNFITKKTKGIHIRATDWPSKMNVISDAYETIQKLINEDSNVKIFVCSDEKEIEENVVSQLPDNVFTFPKNSYAEKAGEGGWHDESSDIDGRKFNWNVRRNEESCVEAFIDMLILSRTDITFGHPASSFYYFANIYSELEELK